MKRFIMLSLALLMALQLTACNGGGGETTTPEPETPTEEPEITTEEVTEAEVTTAEITTEEVTTEPEETSPPKDLSGAVLTDIFEAKRFVTSAKARLNYRIYVPEDYDASKSYPLLVFLHGSGERGSDNAAQLKNGIGQLFKKVGSPILDCIIIAPQCPSGMKWVEVSAWTDCNYSTEAIPESVPLKGVVELIGEIKKEYSIDEDRLYASGISMGGYGTWDLLVRHGDMFAAAIPVCGGCDVSKAAQIANIPVFTFHGKKDTTVPNTGTLAMVDAMKAAGGKNIELVEYPNGAHSIWEQAYAHEGLAEWLLSHKLSDRK